MKKRILIVDDASYMRAILEDILVRNDFEVVGKAKNGVEAIEIYRKLLNEKNPPDLVLMDITMKKMDGITALNKIKEMDEKARVIMCSSIKTKDALVKAVQAGAFYFILKPFEEEELVRTVLKAFEKK